MSEWYMILAMGTGGICFAIGGTGFKWVRRFLMPAILALLCLFNGFAWWACLGYALTQSLTLCLPYGEKRPYWQKFIVFVSYPLPSLFFGLTWWQPISAIGCFLIFLLSNWKVTEKTFAWKICEFSIGSFLGITIASLISQNVR